MYCDVSHYIWEVLLSSLKVLWVWPDDFKNMLLSWKVDKVSKRVKIIWHLIPFAICWEIWLERNRRRHGGRHRDKEELVYAIKMHICLWRSTTTAFQNYSMNQIFHHWEDIMHM